LRCRSITVCPLTRIPDIRERRLTWRQFHVGASRQHNLSTRPCSAAAEKVARGTPRLLKPSVTNRQQSLKKSHGGIRRLTKARAMCKRLAAVTGISMGGRMRSRLTAMATAGALLISVEISAALAGSVTQPGERVASRLARPFRQAFISPIRRTGAAGTQLRPIASALRFQLSLGLRLGRFSGRGCSFFR
jgi:hypothetical protein